MPGRRKRGEVPQIRQHKPSGRAYVYAHGRTVYLGPWDSPESRTAYRDFLSRWDGPKPPGEAPQLAGKVRVYDFVAAFTDWAATHYRRADGTQTTEYNGVKFALTFLIADHGNRFVDDFGARDLRAMLSNWKASGQVRHTINQRLERIKRAFRWGANRDLVAPSTLANILVVHPLRHGEAPDNDEIQPVPLRDLVRTIKELPAMTAAIVHMEYYCGARPSEACAIRGDQIYRRSFRIGGKSIRVPDGLAVYLPKQHKTAHRGEIVFYTLGPRAQAAIEPWLNDGPIFQLRAGRPIDYATYVRHIKEAAERAGAEHWSPNQLRHNFMTRWDSLAGIEAAGAAVRHKSLDTSAIYIQRDLAKVGQLAAKFG